MNLNWRLAVFPLLLINLGCHGHNRLLPSAYDSMKACNESSSIEQLKFNDMTGNQYSVFWSDSADKNCPGPNHPRLIAWNDKVEQWIQIIEVNILPPNQQPYVGPSWNLTGNNDRWVYLDVLPEKAKQKHFYYNDTPQPNFHDNPAWSGNPPNGRKWIAHLWGLSKGAHGKLRPVVGISWGFSNDPGRDQPVSIRPSAINRSIWFQDKKLLEHLARKWKIDSPFE